MAGKFLSLMPGSFGIFLSWAVTYGSSPFLSLYRGGYGGGGAGNFGGAW